MSRRLAPVLLLALALLVLALLIGLGPRERTLGPNVRLVYLHGAWVWAALLGLAAAAVAGAIGLVTRGPAWHAWSRALGVTGTVFWVTYLPISLLTMQLNWNALFLQEPRWRIGLDFALAGLILQVGLTLVGRPSWNSAANLAYFALLAFSLGRAEQVMHPPSPITASGPAAIQGVFLGMLAVSLFAEWQLARWLRATSTLRI